MNMVTYPGFATERMLHTDYDSKGSVEGGGSMVVILKGLCATLKVTLTLTVLLGSAVQLSTVD